MSVRDALLRLSPSEHAYPAANNLDGVFEPGQEFVSSMARMLKDSPKLKVFSG